MERKATDFIVIHCTATMAHMDVGATEIAAWHRHHGWDTIGYHWVIKRDGKLEAGRAESLVGAHAKGYNRNSIGVCLVGGINEKKEPEDNFTLAQYKTMHNLLVQLRLKYPKAEILGHRDLSPDLDGDGVIERHEWIKDCPCFDVQAWLAKNDPELALFDE